MSKILILAEKPSVARDIARVVHAHESKNGYFEGDRYWVSWAIGHLVTLPEPHEINSDWKKWTKTSLPLLPREWPLQVIERTESQFRIVEKLFSRCEQIICATDAGREGELIFRYIYEMTGCKKPVKRLWISTLTSDAIEVGLNNLKDQKVFDSLGDAARARSCADWLVGMNLSRAYTLQSGAPYFVGRVQTPTLAILVKRELEIKNFKVTQYFEIKSTFRADANEDSTYTGYYVGVSSEFFPPNPGPAKRFPESSEEVSAICKRLPLGKAHVLRADSKILKELPPLFYDLTELQRHANRLYGYSAAFTLSTAQALYEKYKIISYPRSDSRHLSEEIAKTIGTVARRIASRYPNLDENTGLTPLPKRFVNDQEVSDHHAIIPTSAPLPKSMAPEEQNIFDLICRRVLSAWQGDHVTSVKTVYTELKSENFLDLFKSQGTAIQSVGWKRLDLNFERDQRKETFLPKSLETGLEVELTQVQRDLKSTQPPPKLNDSSLLKAMETAGRDLDDQDLAKVMSETGLGTAATRSGMIETLLTRGYAKREGRALIPTQHGMDLIEAVHPSVKSPDLTARWEKELQDIQKGKQTLKRFLTELESEIKKSVQEVFATPIQKPHSFALKSAEILPLARVSSFQTPTEMPKAILPEESLASILKRIFGFAAFRPHQEMVCKQVTEGQDVLLVMPTGAGKSLCYQLPGMARKGTTIVIAPLLALIEDQVEKLVQKGLRADRIHSGRKREDSRRVCSLYLSGQLDFLFIAPERLSVPGFPEMLTKRMPTLIAIDEAHCISQWGHDFRPDYRQLGERLKPLRSAPIIALTATATTLVQNDIVTQLGMDRGLRSVHGFRRDNIAIHISEIPVGKRLAEIKKCLAKKNALPAIVYAPTRKMTDHYYSELKDRYRAGYYHAGLTPAERERHQEKFLRGELDVMVATIAFGMGIDKADIRTIIHAAAPGSVEGYYQEIGRAGRDGNPSRAILLQSAVDRKTHEYFFKRDYPEVKTLQTLFTALIKRNMSKTELRSLLPSLDFEALEKGIEKLLIHGGARIDSDQMLSALDSKWQRTYLLQREHREEQMTKVSDYIESSHCRMLALIRYFGDQNDLGDKCKLCDLCLKEKKKPKPTIRKRKAKSEVLASVQI